MSVRSLSALFRRRAPRVETTTDDIGAHLIANHVLGLCVVDDAGPWAASCYYAVDLDTMELFVMSSPDTRHGRAMALRPDVAGTIAGQPEEISEIRGIQFTARAKVPVGSERERALAVYRRRHPIAARMPGEIWSLRLQTIKFTDNRHVFGKKTLWSRRPDPISSGGHPTRSAFAAQSCRPGSLIDLDARRLAPAPANAPDLFGR